MRVSKTIVVIALALATSPSFAQEMGIYVGVVAASFDYDEDPQPGPFGAISDTTSSWKLYGGFEINEHLAVEISYGATSDLESTASGSDSFLGNFTSTQSLNFKTTAAKAMGLLPLERVVLLGGIGYFDTELDFDARLTATCCGTFSATGATGDNGLVAALGAEWRFGRFGTGIDVRLEYEWFDLEDADTSAVGIGVGYRF
jgi:opacity protein-like surface antigen